MVRSSTKESPAATGQSQGQEAASERGQERSEEAAWRSGSRSRPPLSVISTESGVPQEHVRRQEPYRPSHPAPGETQEEGRRMGGRPLDIPTQEYQGRTDPSQGEL